MNEVSFLDFCRDLAHRSDVFFMSSDRRKTYQDLLQLSSVIGHSFRNRTDSKMAVICRDPYFVFASVLAALFTDKEIVLLPAQTTNESLSGYPADLAGSFILSGLQDLEGAADSYISLLLSGSVQLKRPFLTFFTSGSSGRPKAITHSLETLTTSAQTMIEALGMKHQDKTYLNLPVHHVGGQMILWRSFLSGGIVDTTGKHFDFASFVPLQIERLLNNDQEKEKLLKARGILIGGGILTASLKNKMTGLKISFYETYGMTETASAVMLNGVLLRNQQLKIHDNHILIKGPTLAPDVPRDEEGFFRTNDRGEKTADGKFRFIERSDLCFKSGGELINPELIETVVRVLPWIKEAVIVGLPDKTWNMATTLLYDSTAEYDQHEEIRFIKDHIRKSLHPYMVPKHIFHHPSSQSGLKPSRFLLKEKALQYLSRIQLAHDFMPANQNQKKLMVFFHGFMGSREDLKECYAETIQQSAEDLALLFIDLPGHGESHVEPFLNRDDAFLKLAALIRSYQDTEDGLIFYGYSMGGRVALQLALLHLNVSKLIIESAAFGLDNAHEQEVRLKNDQSLFQEKDFDLLSFLRRWYNADLFYQYSRHPRFESDLHKKLQHNYHEWEKALLLFTPASDLLHKDILHLLKTKSSMQTIMVTGGHDLKYHQLMLTLSRDLNLPLQIISDAGHNPHRTHPAEMQAFLLKSLTLK